MNIKQGCNETIIAKHDKVFFVDLEHSINMNKKNQIGNYNIVEKIIIKNNLFCVLIH